MNIVSDVKTYTASEARDNLYSLIKKASSRLSAFEITLRGSESVILINKAELEEWQETFDILSNKNEAKAVRVARKQKKTISHSEMLRQLNVKP
jgi:prevent-host-death family protein